MLAPPPPALRRPRLALVHHANQLVITDGYDNREGLTELLEAYAAVLALHRHHRVPAALHLSGTLLEAIAWQRPEFLETVRRDVQAGGLTLLGGTYAENVMPLFDDDHNRRQLAEGLRLCADLLAVAPTSLTTAWVPERVWHPRLASVLADATLANGGFSRVLLDDRVLFAIGGEYVGSPRERFDALGPYGSLPAGRDPFADIELLREAARPYRIASTQLELLPISANLRYWAPPRNGRHWEGLHRLGEALHSPGEPALLVYADDLERTAGVGPWEPALDRLDAFLAWLARTDTPIDPVSIDAHLAEHPPRAERDVEPGTFFELAREWDAGEDYAGWAGAPAWRPYAAHVRAAEQAVRAAERAIGSPALVELASKQVLVAAHETAWHDGDGAGGRAPAHWARAAASHARAALPLCAAALHLGTGDRAPLAVHADIDDDGEEEVVLAHESLFAVLSPAHGGRVVLLVHDDAVIVGNPIDHWNWQEELNRYMDAPANHPGAFADRGGEHTDFAVAGLGADDDGAWVALRAPGVAKTFSLARGLPALVAGYATDDPLETEVCLSPDYLRLLRRGGARLREHRGERWAGAVHGRHAGWVLLAPDSPARLAVPHRTAAGHGFGLRVHAAAGECHLALGCGPDGLAAASRALAGEGDRRSLGTGAPSGAPVAG